MTALIVIPARHASTRLPGKPLLKQTGKYLIQHVYERAALAKKARAVIVATDDPLIVPAALDLVIERLEQDETADMATLACPLTGAEQYHNPNCVKVVTDDAD